MRGVVGIVGLGIMGGAMARNLQASGWRVLGYDIDADRCQALIADGIEPFDDLVSLARAAPTIMTSLPSAKAAAATAHAIAGSGAGQRVVLEASTLALDDKLAFAAVLEAAGHVALDCPISGTGAQAVTKDLVIYASGRTEAIEAVRPMLADLARLTHDLGRYGNGTRMKFVANLLVAIHNVATAEAMVLGIKSGLDPRQLVHLVTSGAGNSRVFELRAPMMAEGHYEPPTMRCEIWQKDMDVINRFAQQLGCPTPLLSATLPIYASAMATGHAGHDTAAVCAVLERMAGVHRDGDGMLKPES